MTCIGGMMNEFLTPEDVAGLLRLHLKTVYKLAKKGELPGSRIGRSWRFRRSDVEALVAHKEKAA
jgi:excisionase family DNA binding protein